VRAQGETARIELTAEEMKRMLEPGLMSETAAFFRQAGFTFVSLDLDGYRCGSMNPVKRSETAT
jgi:uncharacterized protein